MVRLGRGNMQKAVEDTVVDKVRPGLGADDGCKVPWISLFKL